MFAVSARGVVELRADVVREIGVQDFDVKGVSDFEFIEGVFRAGAQRCAFHDFVGGGVRCGM